MKPHTVFQPSASIFSDGARQASFYVETLIVGKRICEQRNRQRYYMENLDQAAQLQAEAMKAIREATELLKRVAELIQLGKISEALELQKQAEEKQIKSRRLIERASHFG